jgi:hypothetical protein
LAEELRAWIARMNDAELARFGQAAAHMCASKEFYSSDQGSIY